MMVEIAFTAIAFLCGCAYVGWAYGWDGAAAMLAFHILLPAALITFLVVVL